LSRNLAEQTNNYCVRSNKAITMNKEERQHHIVQLIEESNGQQLLGTRELASSSRFRDDGKARLAGASREGLLHAPGGASPTRPPQLHRKDIPLVSKIGKFTDFLTPCWWRSQTAELGYRIALSIRG
jgi:hypothetical protein